MRKHKPTPIQDTSCTVKNVNSHSFDHVSACPKCGADWEESRKALYLNWVSASGVNWLKQETAAQQPEPDFSAKSQKNRTPCAGKRHRRRLRGLSGRTHAARSRRKKYRHRRLELSGSGFHHDRGPGQGSGSHAKSADAQAGRRSVSGHAPCRKTWSSLTSAPPSTLRPPRRHRLQANPNARIFLFRNSKKCSRPWMMSHAPSPLRPKSLHFPRRQKYSLISGPIPRKRPRASQMTTSCPS